MKSNNKISIIIVFITVILLYGVFNLIEVYKEKRLETILENHSNNIQTYYEISDYHQKSMADTTFKETVVNNSLIYLLQQANYTKKKNDLESLSKVRNQIKALLDTKYQFYKEKGILQYHFVFPDNTVLLRMHKPSKFGDDLTGIRTDFMYVNKHLKPIRGFAQGRTSHAFRNVYPIIVDNKHLASVEISFSSDLLQKYFSEVNKIHTHFLVRKDIFDSKAWQRDDLILKYQPSSEHSNYMITLTGVHTAQKCIIENKKRLATNYDLIHEKINETKKFSVYSFDGEEKSLVVSFYPVLQNVTKEPVAWIVSYQRDQNINDTIFYSYFLFALISLVIIVFAVFIYYLLNQRKILNKMIAEKTSDLVSSNEKLKLKDKELQAKNHDLKESEVFLTSIMESAIDGIVTINEKGIIQTFNKAASELFGYSKEEAIGQNVKILVPSPHYENHDQYLKNYIQSGIKKAMGQTAELGAKRKDGTIFPASIRIGEVILENKRIFTALVQDDTQRKAYESALVEAKDVAEEAAKSKSEFLANMSHEIRTPMNAIIGIIFLLQQTELNDKQYSYVQKVDNAAKHLLGIINDVLDYSKIEAGRMQLEYVDFNFHDILDSLSDMFTLKIKDKDLEFLFDVDINIPYKLVGDQLRLSQVLINIIGNAIKFTDKGLIVLSIRLLGNKNNKAHLEFSITDTGIGMDEEQSKKVFTTYSQADSSTTRKFGGSGLGLSISQYLINLMGGEIKIESQIDKGSKFTFDINIDMQDDQTVIEYVKNEPLKVLIVDDNEVALNITTKIVESFGYETKSVDNGIDAVNFLKICAENKMPYELLILDYKMPNIDGIDTLELIHKELKSSDLPKVIMLSSTDINILQNSVKNNMVDEFLSKPFSQSHLYDIIIKLFYADKKVLGKSSISKSESYKDYISLISGSHMLLVEDNEQNQEIAVEYLKKANITADIANNGIEALEMITKKEYDGVLMDCQMPIMDGYEATGEIREFTDEKLMKIPIIAMTANAMQGDRERCIVSGMDDYISKPIDINKMFKTISKWVNPKKTIIFNENEIDKETDYLIYEKIGLNARKAIFRMGDDEALYREQLKRFIKSQKDFLDEVTKLSKNNDIDSLIRIAHTLKGLSGGIGADNLYEDSKELENYYKQNDVTEYKNELVEKIDIQLKILINDINDLFKDEKVEENENLLNEIELNDKLKLLRTLLESFDVDSVEVFNEIKNTLKIKLDKKVYDDLENYIDGFEFDEAIDILNYYLS